jgi:hypothetical protein
MTRKPYRVHAARLVLAEHGYTVSAVADHAGVYPSTITRQLAGERSLADSTVGALVALCGADGAEQVIEAIPNRTEQAAA